MGFLGKLFGGEPKLISLVTARIATDKDHRYFVSLRKHRPDVRSTEFVRLVLHYYAKMLYNFDPKDSDMLLAAVMLNRMVQSLIDKGVEKNSNIFLDVGIDDVAAMVSTPPRQGGFQITVDLFFVDTLRRHLTSEFPNGITTQHVVFSVFALLQAALTEMDSYCIEVLGRALMAMNDTYRSGQRYSELRNVAAVPTGAYMSAIMSE